MDEILSLAEELNNEFAGYLRRDDRYHRFTFKESGLKIEDTWEVGEFKNYEHFAARIGKWDPESLFLADPIKVKELTVASLKKVFDEVKRIISGGEEGVNPELSRELARVVNSPLFLRKPIEFQDSFRKRAMKAVELSDLSKEDQDFIRDALNSVLAKNCDSKMIEN